MRSFPRLIDPREQIRRSTDDQLGVVTSGIVDRRLKQVERNDASPRRNQLIITSETIVGHRADPAANTSSTMLTVIPTSSTGFASLARSLYIPAQARVTFVRITANDDLTAGTATPELRVVEDGDVTLYTFDEAALDTTYPNSKAAHYDWTVARQIAAGATVTMRVLTSSGYLPTTNDISILFVLSYGEWVSS